MRGVYDLHLVASVSTVNTISQQDVLGEEVKGIPIHLANRACRELARLLSGLALSMRLSGVNLTGKLRN